MIAPTIGCRKGACRRSPSPRRRASSVKQRSTASTRSAAALRPRAAPHIANHTVTPTSAAIDLAKRSNGRREDQASAAWCFEMIRSESPPNERHTHIRPTRGPHPVAHQAGRHPARAPPRSPANRAKIPQGSSHSSKPHLAPKTSRSFRMPEMAEKSLPQANAATSRALAGGAWYARSPQLCAGPRIAGAHHRQAHRPRRIASCHSRSPDEPAGPVDLLDSRQQLRRVARRVSRVYSPRSFSGADQRQPRVLRPADLI